MYQQLDSETQETLEKIFSEIQEKSISIFLQGIRNITPANLKELKKFEIRLLDLGLDYLATEFNTFRKIAQKVIGSPGTQSSNNQEQIEDLVRIFIRITSYLRVFERVKSRNLNLKNLHDGIGERFSEDNFISKD